MKIEKNIIQIDTGIVFPNQKSPAVYFYFFKFLSLSRKQKSEKTIKIIIKNKGTGTYCVDPQAEPEHPGVLPHLPGRSLV